jgi:hypothetical protein
VSQTSEKSPYLRVPNPVAPLPHVLLPKRGERLVRALPRPQARRELVKVLLGESSPPQGHGALHPLVFTRRQSNGPLTPVRFGEPVPPHGRRLRPPTAQPLRQVPQGLFQVLGLPRCPHPVDPRRAVFARAVRRLAQKGPLPQVRQRRETPLWILLRLLCNPLAVRCEGWGSPSRSPLSSQANGMPGGAFPPGGSLGLGSPPSSVLCSAKTALSPSGVASRPHASPSLVCFLALGSWRLVHGRKLALTARALGQPLPLLFRSG